MVSVCLASFNGEKYIREQIDSILQQLSEEDELIISDDGSTDNTISIIESYNDNRMKLLNHVKQEDINSIRYNKNHYFVTANFENAIENASGDYIFLSDQDDVWVNGKVKKMVEALTKNDFVFCNYRFVDSNLSPKEFAAYKKNPIPKSYFKNILFPSTLGCCIAFRKSLLNIILPFPRNLISHDLWITCLAIKEGKCSFLPEVLHLYRRTDNNVSRVGQKSKNSLVYKISYRLKIFRQLNKRIREVKHQYV